MKTKKSSWQAGLYIEIANGHPVNGFHGGAPGGSAGELLIEPAAVPALCGCKAERVEHIPLLSFFTGGGFFDLGFERAGFEIRWSNEFNDTIADMHDYAYTHWRRAAC